MKKTSILLLTTLLFTLPAQAQIKGISKAAGVSSKAAEQLSRQVSRQVSGAMRNAQAFTVGLSNSPTKQILNQRLQFQREYARAIDLYQNLQTSSVNPERIRTQIQQTIVNNTLRASLLNNLDKGLISNMTQELEQYFNLMPKLPFFSSSADPSESFAVSARGYLMLHAQKPSWQLREIIKFGGMNAIKLQCNHMYRGLTLQEELHAHNLDEDEAEQLLAMYARAEELNTTIKEFISKKSHSRQEYEEIMVTLQQMNDLYEKLLTFATNSTSVRSTVEIYKNLLADMQKFVAEHHRAPVWQNPLERSLHNLFAVLVFNNQINQFEEIIPLMTQLYEISEMYPAKRMTEKDALESIKAFKEKHGFWPRSVKIRDFFDARPKEAMLVEAGEYWKQNSADFTKKLNELMFPHEKDFFPPYF